jgi:ureidoglycolate lyase
MRTLQLERLSKAAFAPFGDVIETGDNDWFPINDGYARRYHKLGLAEAVGVADGSAQVAISVVSSKPALLPIDIRMLERHPLGSQAFIPCNGTPYIVVVAKTETENNVICESSLRAFYADGEQGVNYYRGTWHHTLLPLDRIGNYIVVDRIGSGDNCDVIDLQAVYRIEWEVGKKIHSI